MKISLCCGRARCPTIENEGDDFIIRDDYDGEVTLTMDELKELINKAEVILKG